MEVARCVPINANLWLEAHLSSQDGFDFSLDTSITVSAIGIPRERWVAAEVEDELETASRKMAKERFDILPNGDPHGVAAYW